MSTVTTLETVSTSSDATEKLGARLGQALRGGEVIELVSDLGGGKTTFVKGIAKGIGSHDSVASPSFTVSRIYEGGKFELHHFDFYRMQKPGHLTHELREVAGEPDVVVVVEWADIVQHVLPEGRLTIFIKTINENTRRFTLNCPKELQYLTDIL